MNQDNYNPTTFETAGDAVFAFGIIGFIVFGQHVAYLMDGIITAGW